MGILDKILRAGEGKTLRTLEGISRQVNAIEDDFVAMTDEELRALTGEYRTRLEQGETLDDLLPEAFATVREAARRTLGQRHYDVQIMGGAALHLGNIAEMRTGEGKTLVATLPSYLNALSGNGVHVVTVNDYLAERDSEWMGRIHRFLGLDVGVILAHMSPAERREAYAADITYGTNNEFGFDYLRDNMAWSAAEMVQRGHNFAVVDEVDSILVDEARTPLIISGPADQPTKWYAEFARMARLLVLDEDYEVDEKKKTIGVLEAAIDKVEDQLGIDNLYDTVNTPLVGFLNNAIRAKELFKRDRDYVILEGEILIVDEHTGRLLKGRRYNEGLHQAIEAKEGVEIKAENQTLATVTLQNYFRLYDKLSGMTGTAMTEAAEFHQIYALGVVPIPTNRPMVRLDEPDLVYRTVDAKYVAVIDDIEERNAAGQPVLVGTTSVAKSELIAAELKKRGVRHEVLNAKNHEREATIIAEAGHRGAVTVATNMAGRGTDIMLGGNPEFRAAQELETRGLDPVEDPEAYEKAWPEALATAQASVASEHEDVVDLGGLYVLGTERHESRRIDNQLRGRSGRQGDPGETRFYLSLEDPLLRIFAGERINKIMVMLKMPEGEAIEHRMVTNSIESAQRKVEARNFDIRKQLLEYDDVSNDQRRTIYQLRNELLDTKDVTERITDLRAGVVTDLLRMHVPAESVEEQWDIPALEKALAADLQLQLPVKQWLEKEPELSDEDLLERIIGKADDAYAAKVPPGAEDSYRQYERYIMLQILDSHWREHLAALDHLRQGIHLRGYAQKNPKQEYKREAFELFGALIESVKLEVTRTLIAVQIKSEAALEVPDAPPALENMSYQHADPVSAASQASVEAYLAPPADEKAQQPFKRYNEKIGRNDPCPCGSGKKYKQCHGKLA